ncbi:MAG: TRAP transporter substrate-binding protein [Clostridiales bacterium]|nr:TRAP transporter substrate-binding protein [Clostridiales bacterium]
MKVCKQILWSVMLLLLTGCAVKKPGTEILEEVSNTEEMTGENDTIKNEENVHHLAVASSIYSNFPEEYVCQDGTVLQFYNYPDSVLGSDSEMIQGCQTGTVSIFLGAVTVETEVVPELAMLDIPYLLDDLEDYREALPELMEYFQPYYQAKGLQLLTWDVSYLGCFASKKKVEHLSDLKGLRLRTQENVYHQVWWEALGADVESLSFDELGYRLQKNQIDGAEAGLPALEYTGYMEEFDYLILTNHMPAMGSIVMNKEDYDSLSAQAQKELIQLVQQKRSNKNGWEELRKKNTVEFVEPDEEFKEKMKEKSQVVEDLLKKNLGESLVNEFLDYVDGLNGTKDVTSTENESITDEIEDKEG